MWPMRTWLVAVLLTGCGGYQVTASPEGATYPSRGDDCQVRYENLPWHEASARYRYLGSVMIGRVSADDHPSDIEKDVTLEACRMGGEVITPFANGIGFMQFSVWRTG